MEKKLEGGGCAEACVEPHLCPIPAPETFLFNSFNEHAPVPTSCLFLYLHFLFQGKTPPSVRWSEPETWSPCEYPLSHPCTHSASKSCPFSPFFTSPLPPPLLRHSPPPRGVSLPSEYPISTHLLPGQLLHIMSFSFTPHCLRRPQAHHDWPCLSLEPVSHSSPDMAYPRPPSTPLVRLK